MTDRNRFADHGGSVRRSGWASVKRDCGAELEPPPLDAHPFEARGKLFVLVRELYELAALIGIALELDRVPGEPRPLAISLGGWVKCGFEPVHDEDLSREPFKKP